MGSTRGGWLGARWGRLLALLLAVGLFVASLVVPWTSIFLAVFVVTPDNNLLSQDDTTTERLSELGLPGVLYAGLGTLLLLLAVAAVAASRGAVSRALAGASAVVAGIALVDLLVAWRRFRPAHDDAVQKLAELTRVAAAAEPADKDAAWLETQTPGISLGLLAVVVVLMLAAVTVRPGTGPTVTAATGSLLLVFCLVAPWATSYRVTGDGVERYHEWWFRLGAATVGVVAGTLVLAGLAWWAALRRSTGGRLPLLLCSLALAPALIVAQLNLPVDADDRVSAAELAPYLNIETEPRAAFPLHLFAILVLGLAALLAWRAAGRRAQPTRPVTVSGNFVRTQGMTSSAGSGFEK